MRIHELIKKLREYDPYSVVVTDGFEDCIKPIDSVFEVVPWNKYIPHNWIYVGLLKEL